jgi:hypothetical protein
MEVSKPTSPIVISAYQRPEKLVSRYNEVKDWTNFGSLTISIDGLRPKSNVEELLNRGKVIEVAEDIALHDNRVDVLVWNENSGVNDHAARLFAKMKNSASIILIEDDVGVNKAALNFLHDNVLRDGSLASTAHVSRNHLELSATDSRISVFPNQWGLAISTPVMETYLDVIKTKKFNRQSIRKAFYRAFENHMTWFQIERLVQWWFNHFFFCERHGNWADALIQYSVYVNDGFYRVPAQSLIVDDNALNDLRSMHPRESFQSVMSCEFGKRQQSGHSYTCDSCEVENSRLYQASIRNLIGATKHRKFLQFRRI